MNKKQLAKLLIKHPEIKSLYESRAFDTSTINKIIAEEIMEADLSDAQKDEIRTLRDYMQLLRDQATAVMEELRDAKLDGDEEGVKELSAELEAMKQKRSEVLKKIKAIQASAEKAAEEAGATESSEDDQQVAQAIKNTVDAMKPAVDAAKQDADIAAKVDAVAPKVDNAVQVAQDELGDIEIEDEGTTEAQPESELPADNEEVIIALNDEIESFKAMLENPEEWELTDVDIEDVKQGIADRTAELEKLGVAVAKTDSKKDDQAVTQALQSAKPEIEQAKTSNDGKPDMAALDAAIMKALQNAQSGAEGANDELDLSGIEIVDDESDGTAAKIQKYAESSSSYLSNLALLSAGTALVAPPSAPVTLPASKLAGWASTVADVVALGAAIVNDDKEGMMKNGAATAIGVGTLFIPGGEGAKLMGKEAATETIKVAAKEGAEVATKEISKEVAEKVAQDLGTTVAELATKEVTEQVLQAATDEVAKQALSKTIAQSAMTKAGKSIYAQAKEEGFFTSDSGEEFTEEELRQIGEAAIQKATEKTASALENKTGDDFKAVTDAAAEETGMLDNIKSFFGFGSEASDSTLSSSEEPATVTLNNSTPKLKQLASAFAKLTDEQHEQLRGIIESEIDKVKVEQNPWQELPQGLQQFAGSDAILMFEPGAENMMTLSPKISDIIPINDENGESVTFEVAEQEIVDNEEEIQKMDQKLKEKETMANQKDAVVKKAQDSWNKWKNEAFKETTDGEGNPVPSNIEDAEGLFKQELERRLNIYLSAKDWSDLAELGHQVPEGGTPETLEQWQLSNKKELEKYFEDVKKRMSSVKNLDAQRAAEGIQDVINGLAAETSTIQDSINNVAAADDVSDADVAGDTVGGTTRAQEIRKVIKDLDENAPEFPTLLGNDRFAELLFAKLQAATPEQPNSDASGEEDSPEDAQAGESVLGTRFDSNSASIDTRDDAQGLNLEEALSGIYLAEDEAASSNDQAGVNPPAGDEQSGSAMSIEDATKLRDEIQKMQEIFGKSKNDKVKTINVMDLAKQAGLEVPEKQELTAEQGATDGDKASETDAQRKAASFAETYAALIPSMDNFFSTEQATRLGFMEQFLLESQSAMLWGLIGNLNLIAEKGKARAFTKRKEKEQAQLSGQGSPEEQGDLQAEGIGDFFKRDKEPVEISKEDQISLKTDLKALLQTLRATKSMIGSYEKNMTKVSVDPGLDGSALKEQLDQYLPMVQKSIAKIIERANEAFIKATELNARKEEPEATQPADDENQEEMDQEQMVEAILEAIAPALDGMHGLQEETGRDETINFVDGIYNEMRAIYAPVGEGEDSEGLRGFMEVGDRARAIQQAERMLEVATKEEFIKLFPGGRIGEGGMPATVNAAIETLGREIKKLVLIMRDVVTLASKSTIPHSKLAEIVSSLTTISKSIYNSFGAKMMISGETLEQIETRLGEDEDNKSLTDTPSKPGLIDKAEDLIGKGLEKLKQMFGWLGEETLKLLANLIDAPDLAKDPMFIKFVEPFGELVVKQGGELTAKSEGSPETKQVEELMVKTLESKSWFDSLKPEQQSAVTELIDGIYKDKRMLQELDMADMGIVPSEVRNQISSEYQFALVSVLKKMDEEKQNLLTSLMSENEDEFVSYLVNQHELRQKMGEEKTKVIGELTLKTSGPLSPKGTDPSKRNADKPTVSADVEFDDEEVKSLDWYRSLEKGEQAAVQSFATNLLNLLRRSGKAQDLNLIDEGYEKFFADLKNKYGSEDVGKEMSKALNSMKGATKAKVMNLMEEQPEQFSQFVYELTTSADLGDAIFGPTPEQPKSKTPSDIDKEKVRKKELIDFISKKSMGMSKDPKRGFAVFLNKYYLPEKVDNDRVVKTGYDKMYSKSKELSQAQKKCLIDWVMQIAKRIEKGLSSGKNVKSEAVHPADHFSYLFRDNLKRLGVSTKGIGIDDLSGIVRNALSTAAGSDSKLDSYWIDQIKDNAEETSDMLSTLVRIHRTHKMDGLYAMVFQNLPASMSENDIIKMYNRTVKDYEDRLKTDQDYEYLKSLNDASDEFDDENDSNSKDIEEALKPIIEKMLNEHYNH